MTEASPHPGTLDDDLPGGVTVQAGQIQVSTVAEVISHDDVRIYEIDCHSKYFTAEVVSEFRTDADGPAWSYKLWLTGNDRTRNADKTTEAPTVLTFEVPAEESSRWQLMSDDTGRYSVRAVLFRQPE